MNGIGFGSVTVLYKTLPCVGEISSLVLADVW